MMIEKLKLLHCSQVILNLFLNRLPCIAMAFLIVLSACTDYEGVLDDNYGKWKEEQANIESSADKLDSSEWLSSSSNKIQYGTLIDSRDNHIYKTIVIGNQTWMAENLNFAYNGKTSTLDSSSFCYNNSADSCSKYGRLYLWSAAMDSAAVFSTGGKGCGYGKTCSTGGNIRGSCPEGWHVPSDADWLNLFSAIGGTDVAGKVLKSSSGWYNDIGNGIDSYGFMILPAGYRYLANSFTNIGWYAYFWSTAEDNVSNAYYWSFYYLESNVNRFVGSKDRAYSVRCLKDTNSVSDDIEKSSSSSSSVNLSSSQSLQSSSSISIEYGFCTDARDERIYKTVTIGSQTWMAENLNFAYKEKTSSLDSSSFCYNNSADSCAKYGRLYLWSAAMDSAAIFSTAGKGCGYGSTCSATGIIRGVCPAGWHLPSRTEWSTLFTAVGGINTAGTMLKSISGWNDGGSGEDSYGFSVLPAGNRNNNGNFNYAGNYAFFWSSTEYSSSDAKGWDFYYHYAYVYVSSDFKNASFSVRCVKD